MDNDRSKQCLGANWTLGLITLKNVLVQNGRLL
jgi:hypothetical protein